MSANGTVEGSGAPQRRRKVILVGVGGATCSGKTTLAKHLCRCIPGSIIIHQDDFAPPQELIPIHPVHNVQDWDDAPGAIDWPRMRSFMSVVKTTGNIPGSHKSHDHLNEQKDVPLNIQELEKWKQRFAALKRDMEQREGVEVVWGLVDGFLLYWDPEVVSALDTRLFLRVPYKLLKQRRHERHGYHTAVQSDPEGSLWRDPPGYFDDIVYPAYVRAHSHVFEFGDVEGGTVSLPVHSESRDASHEEPETKGSLKGGAGRQGRPVANLVLLECMSMSMDEIFEKACEAVWNASQQQHLELNTT